MSAGGLRKLRLKAPGSPSAKRLTVLVALSAAAILAGAISAGKARSDSPPPAGQHPAVPASSQPPASQPATAAGGEASTQPAPTSGAPLRALGREQPPSPVQPAAGPNIDKLLWTVLAYAVILAVLGVAAVIVVRKVLPRLKLAPARTITVAESVYLGPRKTLHLLHVGSKKLLVASSREQVTFLADVTEACASEPSQRRGGSFQAELDNEA